MKCDFCGKIFKSVYGENICEDCMYSVDELSDGKGGDEEDE